MRPYLERARPQVERRSLLLRDDIDYSRTSSDIVFSQKLNFFMQTFIDINVENYPSISLENISSKAETDGCSTAHRSFLYRIRHFEDTSTQHLASTPHSNLKADLPQTTRVYTDHIRQRTGISECENQFPQRRTTKNRYIFPSHTASPEMNVCLSWCKHPHPYPPKWMTQPYG